MSRDKDKPASLNEVLGKSGDLPALTLENLPVILGEKLPELPLDRVGKFRLRNALKIRFGQGYHNIPGIKSLLGEFDKRVTHELILKLNRRK